MTETNPRDTVLRLAIVADRNFLADPIVQYAIAQWWADHQFPYVDVVTGGVRGSESHLLALLAGDKFRVTVMKPTHRTRPGRMGEEATMIQHSHDTLFFIHGNRGEARTRRLLRVARYSKHPIRIYKEIV